MVLKENKTLLFSVFGTLLLLATLFFILQATHTTHFFQTTAEKQKQQDIQFNADKKGAVVNGNGNPSSTDAGGKPVTNNTGSYTPPNSADGVSIVVSQQGNQVVISTKLEGYSDGSCSLTVTNAGQTNNQTAQIIYAPNFSTCAGFTIPKSDLGIGTWNITLNVTSGGITTPKTTTFAVQ